jgi:hypothetical protein
MSEASLKEKFDAFRQKLLTVLRLQDIDDNESLSFLQRNYNIRASEIVMGVLVLLMAVLLLVDGCNLLASVLCFLLPLSRCMEELAQ